jgi:hypothetical protein
MVGDTLVLATKTNDRNNDPKWIISCAFLV